MGRALRIGLLAVAACGGSASSAPPPVATTAPPPPPPTAAPAPTVQAGPLGNVFTTDPNALASLLASAAAASSALLGPPAANPDAAETGLRAAAAQYAPGLTPEGEVAKATLAEGAHATFPVTLDPSKCYAIVASGAGLGDVDLSLLVPPFYNLLAAQDGMAGSAAVIGASPSFVCPIIALPVPYKVDILAKKGGGPIAAQLYSKKK